MTDLLLASLLLLAFLLYFSLSYYWFLFKLKQKFKDSYMVPHLPIIGIGHLFIGRNFFKIVIDLYSKYKKNLILRIGYETLYVTANVQEVDVILKHPNSIEKAFAYKFFKPGFGDAILVAPAHIWKPNRKCLSKCFNQGLLDTFVPIYYEKSNLLMNVFRKNKDFNLFTQMEKFTLDSFCASAIGLDLNLLQTEGDGVLHNFDRLQNSAIDRAVAPWHHPDFIYFNLPVGKQVLEDLRIVRGLVLNIIREKRKLIEESRKGGFENVPKQVTVVDRMIQFGEEGYFNEKQIVDEALLMIGAATDTSAASMAFTCGMMALHPHVQEKVYEEVMRVIGKDKEILAEDIKQLKYTEMVINESMRIFPSVPVFGREVNGKLDIGTKTLDHKTSILVNAFAIHRDEKHWPEPMKFNPDRFLPEEVAKRPGSAFLPFSLGPRNCIGLRYSYLIMKTNIANVVRNFKIETKLKSLDEIQLMSSIVMKSTNLKCSFIPRTD